jgi:hypothetical protein
MKDSDQDSGEKKLIKKEKSEHVFYRAKELRKTEKFIPRQRKTKKN